MFKTDLYIDGKWRGASNGDRFDVINPADETKLASVASATEADGLAAVDAAHAAMKSWAAKHPRERSEILRRAFDLMTARRDEFARIITLENGKARADAIGEVTYAAEFFRWFSEEATRADGLLNSRTSIRGAHPGSPEARRRRRARHALELPCGDGDSEDRACIGGRLLRRHQARLRNATYHARAYAPS